MWYKWGICLVPPTQPIATKIGMGCPVADVINRAKFQLDRFMGFIFRAPDGRKSLSPIDLRHHPYDSYVLPCYTVIFALSSKNIIRFQHGSPSLFLTSKNVQILTLHTVCTRNLHVPVKFRPDRLNGYGLQVFHSHNGGRPPS